MSGIQPGRGSEPQEVVVVSQTSGTGVTIEKEVVNLGAGLTDDHTYTAVLTSFRPSSVWATASGLIKVEIFNNATKIYTGFNANGPNIIFTEFTENVDIVAGTALTVRITNREVVAQNVYSTICGEQLAVP